MRFSDSPNENLHSKHGDCATTFGAAARAMGGRSTVAWTLATQAVVVLATFAAWKLATVNWGAFRLGEYLLARRVINVLQIPLVCLTQLGLIRFGSMARAANDRYRAADWCLAANLITLCLSLLTLAALNLWPDIWARCLYEIPDGSGLLQATSIAVVGMLMFSVAWSEYWAQMSVAPASLLQIFVLLTPPVVMLLFPGMDVSQTILITGVLWIAASGFSILTQLNRVRWSRFRWPNIRSATFQLVRYGLPRAPGGLAGAALLSAPVIMASHSGDLKTLTFMGAGISLLSMAATVIKPFTQAVLPMTSQMLATQDHHALRSAIATYMIVGALATTTVIAATIVCVPKAIAFYLGPEFFEATGLIRVLLFAIAPYSVFMLTRDFLDALDERPVNARNQFLALIIFFLAAVGGDGFRIAVALTLSISILALLSIGDVIRVVARLNRNANVRDAISSAAPRPLPARGASQAA